MRDRMNVSDLLLCTVHITLSVWPNTVRTLTTLVSLLYLLCTIVLTVLYVRSSVRPYYQQCSIYRTLLNKYLAIRIKGENQFEV